MSHETSSDFDSEDSDDIVFERAKVLGKVKIIMNQNAALIPPKDNRDEKLTYEQIIRRNRLI